ncbi:protein kinase C-binding protein 1 [Anopheles marshallii]|uniref:protein kinase C-binding protein 1 n=1 Tax=Anopheles marshallii TaxID=1521116 RepID=UPI00237BAE6A|nr:protein kinase C-binding protein 1 [Anopheles marshallii]
MSSGSGKKKVVAAAAPSLPFSITPNPVESQAPPTGIKLVIDKNRILNVSASKTQPAVFRHLVPHVQSTSLNASNEDYLTNGGSHAGTSISAKNTAPVVKKVASLTAIGGVERGEMRVKVTGEDRNGQSMMTGGQLVQVKQYNSLLGRRPSTHRRVTVPKAAEITDNGGQQTVSPYPIITLADRTTFKPAVATNIQPGNSLSTTAIPPIGCTATTSSVNLVTDSNTQSSTACNYTVGITDVYSVPSMQFNSVQGKVPYKDVAKKVDVGNETNSAGLKKNIATYTTSRVICPGKTPIIPVNEQNHNVVVITSGENTSRNSNLNAITTDTRKNNVQAKLYIFNPVPNDCTDMNTETSLSKVPGEEVASKPSREVKSLQLMQSSSKILTGFIADTSSKGKLRKRHSDGSADIESSNMDSSLPGTITQSATRKRPRRKSTIYSTTMDDNSKELATDSCYRLEDVDLTSTVVEPARGRKGRSLTKSEYSLQKPTNDRNDCFGSVKDGCRDFFSSLNLGSNEENKIGEQAFPSNPPKPGWDRFCWRCKKSNPNLGCSKCIRSYHKLCVRYSVDDPNWSCTECKMAPNVRADVESMTKCLGYVLDIMMLQTEGVSWNEFFNPIDKSVLPHYDDYITRHMDLAVLKQNLIQKTYKASEEFLADISWIVHNMSIYPDKMILLKQARAMQKKAKNEIDEMEPCYECYIHANTRSEQWFTQLCSKPHLLVWAKMRGFPYWPGKLYVISATNLAYVRFFATHDRSWMAVKDCFLYSKQDPNPPKNLKNKITASLAQSVTDIEQYITRVREQFSTFNYAPFMELVDPSRFEEQQRAMFPDAFHKNVKVTIKKNKGEMVAVASSSNDDTQTVPATKARLELKTNAALANKEPAKKQTIISLPRKPTTRRMSRLLRSADETGEQPVVNAGCQESSTVLIASAAANNDKSFECNQLSDKMIDDKTVETSKDADCDLKTLSLRLRRGSQSATWETEPLLKRRKSTAVLTNAVVETNSTVSSIEVTTKVTNAIKDVAEPIAEKGPNTLDAATDTTCNQHAAKIPSDTVESAANAAAAVSQPLVCISNSEVNPSSSVAEIDIKQEIIVCDEVNDVSQTKDVRPSLKEQVQKENATTLDAAKGQIIPTVSLEKVIKSVQQTTPAVLAISAVGGKADDTNTTAVTIVPSNQRARKSFPGGAGGSTAKNLLPDTLHSSKKALVSIPKELVTPSAAVVTIIPSVDNRKNDHNDVGAASASKDSDEVIIVEDNNDTVATTPPVVPCTEREIETTNFQPLPPLVPKPLETIPAPTDSTIELNNTMQIFDDSANRMLDYFRMVMEDLLKEMVGKGSSLVEVATLKLNLERQKELWMQEKQTLQHEFERKMANLRITLEQEKERALKKQRQQLFGEKERAVQDAKMKQWCAKCYKEAGFYCCWNTLYCSRDCQREHYQEHHDKHINITAQQPDTSQEIQLILQPNLTDSSLLVARKPENNASMRNRSAVNISVVPTVGGGSSNNLNKRSPNNRVAQQQLTSTSTPLQTPVRFTSGTMATNVGYKTPIIQSVHGRDSILKLTHLSTQNGGNATSTLNMPQQQQKKTTPRDKAVQSNHQKAISPNRVNITKKPYVIASSSYQSTNMLTSPTSTNAPMVTPSAYVTVTPYEEVAGSSRASSSVWNQLAVMQSNANRQPHSGTAFGTAGGRDGAEKLGQRQNQPTIAPVVQLPSTATYMRHQQ